jgi:hypothetical protein
MMAQTIYSSINWALDTVLPRRQLLLHQLLGDSGVLGQLGQNLHAVWRNDAAEADLVLPPWLGRLLHENVEVSKRISHMRKSGNPIPML